MFIHSSFSTAVINASLLIELFHDFAKIELVIVVINILMMVALIRMLRRILMIQSNDNDNNDTRNYW